MILWSLVAALVVGVIAGKLQDKACELKADNPIATVFLSAVAAALLMSLGMAYMFAIVWEMGFRL